MDVSTGGRAEGVCLLASCCLHCSARDVDGVCAWRMWLDREKLFSRWSDTDLGSRLSCVAAAGAAAVRLEKNDDWTRIVLNKCKDCSCKIISLHAPKRWDLITAGFKAFRFPADQSPRDWDWIATKTVLEKGSRSARNVWSPCFKVPRGLNVVVLSSLTPSALLTENLLVSDPRTWWVRPASD